MLKEPAYALICQQVLAIPQMRAEKKPVHFLDRTETTALLEAPDASTWSGERDRVLLTVAVETGLRVSELIGLRCQDVGLGTGPHVTCVAKGRKHRTAPLSSRPPPSSRGGYANAAHRPPIRCFRASAAASSAAMRSSGWSPNTWNRRCTIWRTMSSWYWVSVCSCWSLPPHDEQHSGSWAT
jgi:integrase